VSAHLAAAIRGARNAETDLLHQLRKVGHRHVADHDVAGMCTTLAERTQRRIDALDAQLERYGSAVATSGWEGWDHLVAGARRTASKVTSRSPSAGAVLVDDLRSLYLASQEVFLDWTLLKQGAMAVRDSELLEEVKKQLLEVERVSAWAKSRCKLAAPQVLAG
jgi:hypothetical protein